MKTIYQIISLIGIILLTGCEDAKVAMEQAFLKKDYKAVEKMIDEGVDVNIRLVNDNTPLLAASMENNLNLVKFLVKKGADVNLKNKFGDSALNCAANVNSTEIVKLLLKHGADPNNNHIDRSPLLQACQHNNLAIVKLLVKHGSDVNLGDKKNNVPLMYTYDFDIVKYLVSKGGKTDVINSDGSSALMSFLDERLSDKKRIEIMTFLIKHGADVNSIKQLSSYLSANTILDMAINQKYPKELINFLRKHGAKTASELKSEKTN